jgi:hypothetical protein
MRLELVLLQSLQFRRVHALFVINLMEKLLAILAIPKLHVVAILTLSKERYVLINSLQIMTVVTVNRYPTLGAGLTVRRFWPTLADLLVLPVSKISNSLFAALIILTDSNSMLSIGLANMVAMLAILGTMLAIGRTCLDGHVRYAHYIGCNDSFSKLYTCSIDY